VRGRILTLLFFQAVAVTVLANSNIRLEPKGTFYQDDVITIVVAAEKLDRMHSDIVRLKTENLSYKLVEFRQPTAKDPWIIVYAATPTAPGPAWVEADVWEWGERNLKEHIPRVTLDIQPDLARFSNDPEGIFRLQRAAKRTALFVRGTANKVRAYPGQRVEVWWDAVTPEKTIAFYPFNPKLRDLETSALGSSSVSPVKTVGPPPWHTAVQGVRVFPKAPGVLHIPEYLMEAENRMPDGTVVPLRRWTNPVDIEVFPLPPEASKLPVGHFKLDCRLITYRES
jgi:hypothetical protein